MITKKQYNQITKEVFTLSNEALQLQYLKYFEIHKPQNELLLKGPAAQFLTIAYEGNN